MDVDNSFVPNSWVLWFWTLISSLSLSILWLQFTIQCRLTFFDWQTFTTFMSMTTVETLLHRIVLILTSPSFYNPLLQKVQLFRYIISCLRALTFPRGQALWRQEQKKLLPQAKEITFSCVSSLHNKTFLAFLALRKGKKLRLFGWYAHKVSAFFLLA